VIDRNNKQFTPDFPRWTVSRLEDESVLGGTAIYVSGALGGLVSPDVQERTWAEAERVGHLLAEYTQKAVKSISKYEENPPLGLWHAPLYLPNRNLLYGLLRLTGMYYRTLYSSGYLLTEVNLWEVGDFRVATVPGEITPALGLRIKRNTGGRPTMIIGLANDELGYLLPAAEFDLDIYEYERTLCPGYDAADRIVRRIEDLALRAAQRG
jgi:hypothetical protein